MKLKFDRNYLATKFLRNLTYPIKLLPLEVILVNVEPRLSDPNRYRGPLYVDSINCEELLIKTIILSKQLQPYPIQLQR